MSKGWRSTRYWEDPGVFRDSYDNHTEDVVLRIGQPEKKVSTVEIQLPNIPINHPQEPFEQPQQSPWLNHEILIGWWRDPKTHGVLNPPKKWASIYYIVVQYPIMTAARNEGTRWSLLIRFTIFQAETCNKSEGEQLRKEKKRLSKFGFTKNYQVGLVKSL